MTLAAWQQAARAVQLDVVAATHDGADTVLLLGPHEPGFWAVFSASDECADGAPDPLDRWSKRVARALAEARGAEALFPSDGPPFPPFIRWALDSGQVWASPVSLLVHREVGLWTSFRAALRVAGHLELPAPQVSPCVGCDAPCLTACPVGALGPEGYDVARCKTHLNGADSAACMGTGCAVRRSCPYGRTYGRLAEQSAFHMKAFNPT